MKRCLFLFNKNEHFSIKKKLNQLYKNTHPDYFSDLPKQQKINQNSLSLLQSFMDDYKTENNFQLTSKTYLFQFYLKNEIENLIQLNLTGPKPNSGIMEKQMSLNYNLKKLFKSVGLLTEEEQEQFNLEEDDSEFLGSTVENASQGSIIDFILRNKNIKPKERLDPIVNIHKNQLNEILSTRSIDLDKSFDFPFQFELLKKFKDEISKYCENIEERSDFEAIYSGKFKMEPFLIQLRKKLESLRLVIGKGNSRIDEMGNVILNYKEEPSIWMDYLFSNLNKDEVVDKLELRNSILDLELKATSKLGIQGILPESDHILMNPMYISLLKEIYTTEELPTSQMFHINLSKNEKSKLTLIIRDLYDHYPERQPKDLHVHKKGFLVAPLDATLFEIVTLIQMKGMQCISIQQKEITVSNKISELLTVVRKKFRLSSLTYASNLTLQQIQTCCEKLIFHERDLMILHGLDLCISDGFSQRQNGVMEISWNFKIY
eukprot:gene6212-10218_t